MNELICTVVFFGAVTIAGGIVYVAPKIYESIRGFIKWHSHMDVDDM